MSVAPMEQKQPAEAPNFDGLIDWLLRQARLADKQSSARAALAELRRGLRDDPCDRLIVGKYVVRFLGQEPHTDWQKWQETCCFLVAALFAGHPAHKLGVSLGKALGQIQEKSGSIEGRFLSLLTVPSERLRVPLRQIISLLAAHDVPLDWGLLLKDLCRWNDSEKRVQQRWARHFYQAAPDSELDRTSQGETPDEN